MNVCELAENESGKFKVHNWDETPLETVPGNDGERGFSETVLVLDVDGAQMTTAWYDYELLRWSTDCPIDGFREEEMNDDTTNKRWLSFT